MEIDRIKCRLAVYLILMNAVSFCLFMIDLHRHGKTGRTLQPAWIFMVSVLLGGAAGANLYFLLFFPHFMRSKRKSRKVNSIEHDTYNCWRICCLLTLVVQAIFVFTVYGSRIHLSLRQITPYRDKLMPGILFYLVLINLVTFIIFAVDKWKARNNRFRIKEAVLFLLCFLGGTIGGIIGVHALHHKTSRQAFVVGIPLILLVQVVTVIYCCLRLTVLNP